MKIITCFSNGYTNSLSDKLNLTQWLTKQMNSEIYWWGLQLVHLDSYIKSLKRSWFRKILQSENNLLSNFYSVITRSTISKLLQLELIIQRFSQLVSVTNMERNFNIIEGLHWHCTKIIECTTQSSLV